MNPRRLLLPLLAALALAAGDDGVERALVARRGLAGARAEAIFGPRDGGLSGEEREALAFLLAALPLGDLQEGAGKALLADVRASLAARKTVPWGRRVPADLFRQYVLPPRVYTEPLDTFRVDTHRELLARVKGMSMTQAALEMNLWGLSRAAFLETDSRIASLRGMLHSTGGRCVEEAVLLVASLRAVAIPARLVVLPWWGHQDGRHAWVEAWVDGTWRILGALEPRPVLDRGWFLDWTPRASRIHAISVGSRELGSGLAGLEEQDLTARYAPVRPLVVEVVDREGRAVAGATVDLRIFSAAALQLLESRPTDATGRASFRTGGGDLVAWARLGRSFGFRKVDAGAGRVRIPLDGGGSPVEMDLAPAQGPPPRPPWPPAGPAFDKALKEADRLRAAIRAAFLDELRALALAREAGHAEQAAAFLRAARGNWPEILAFLQRARSRDQALALLGCLTAKDTWEVSAEVLLDHLPEAGAPREAMDPWALMPRVDEEPLTACRAWLRSNLPGGMAAVARRDPERLVAWVRDHVRVDPVANPGGMPMPPAVVLSLRIADERSRDVLFVALCRALGIPARLGGLTLLPEYRDGGRWRMAWFGPDPGQGRLLLRGEPGKDLRFSVHCSLWRIREGQPLPMGFPHDLPLAALGAPMLLPAGEYLLVTGNRRKDGAVLARVDVITLSAGGTVTVTAVQRSLPAADTVPAPNS